MASIIGIEEQLKRMSKGEIQLYREKEEYPIFQDLIDKEILHRIEQERIQKWLDEE